VTKDKNIQPNINRKPQKTSTRKNHRWSQRVYSMRLLREPPLRRTIFRSPNYHHLRSEKQTVTHTRKVRERKTLGAWWTGANHTDMSSDHRDQRRLATATGRSLLKKFQPSLVDLALTTFLPKTTNARRSPQIGTEPDILMGGGQIIFFLK